MRVLVVEDHAKLASALAKGLRNEGMAVDVAFDGEDALAHVAGVDYDVVVLDRDLPKIHGDDVCRALVDYGHESRILMLTAASSVDDRVEGLGLGADDYLAKPSPSRSLLPGSAPWPVEPRHIPRPWSMGTCPSTPPGGSPPEEGDPLR